MGRLPVTLPHLTTTSLDIRLIVVIQSQDAAAVRDAKNRCGLRVVGWTGAGRQAGSGAPRPSRICTTGSTVRSGANGTVDPARKPALAARAATIMTACGWDGEIPYIIFLKLVWHAQDVASAIRRGMVMVVAWRVSLPARSGAYLRIRTELSQILQISGRAGSAGSPTRCSLQVVFRFRFGPRRAESSRRSSRRVQSSKNQTKACCVNSCKVLLCKCVRIILYSLLLRTMGTAMTRPLSCTLQGVPERSVHFLCVSVCKCLP